MKKFLSKLLAAPLLLAFSACGNNSSFSSDKDNASSEPTTSSNPVISTPVKIEEPKFPVSTTDIYGTNIVRYELNEECKGYYFTPKAEGKYPTFILIHGMGGVDHSFKIKVQTCMNKWVKEGYIPPMVVVIPEVYDFDKNGYNIDDFQCYIYKSNPNRFDTLLKSIETGSLSAKIDTSVQPYVAGFSMGGMAAVHAGAEYNTRIKHVGGLSPSRSFYLGEGQWGFYNYKKDIHFSSDTDARVYLSAGRAEENGVFIDTINRYQNAIKFNDPDIVTKFIAPESWGPHGWALAQKEIFMYLYFAAHDKLPSDALVEKVCDPNDYEIPTIVHNPEDEHK